MLLKFKHHGWQTLTKVPKINVYFWTLKLLSTAMGEATSDFFVHHINPFVAVITSGIILGISIYIQLKSKRYITCVYWFAVVMVSIFGTMAADATHIVLQVPYTASAIFYGFMLIIIFSVWYVTEKTLSIHSIHTLRREIFYWATVFFTFALGTATGDMTATTFGWGYLLSGIIFAILFLLPGIAVLKFKLNPILAFWISYTLTRPLGASFADYFGVPHSFGGLGLGRAIVAMTLTFFIIILVIYLTKTKKDIQSQYIAE